MGDVNDDFFEFEVAPSAAPAPLVLGKKKKKKKVRKEEPVMKGDKDAAAEPSDAADAVGAGADAGGAVADAGGAGADAADAGVASAFAALGMDDDGDNAAAGAGPAPPIGEDDTGDVALPAKKKKKKKKKPVLDDPTAGGTEETIIAPDAAVEPEVDAGPELELEPEPAEIRRPMTAAEKKKAKKDRDRAAKQEKAAKEAAELDALLEDLGDAPPASSTAAAADTAAEGEATGPMTAAQKKKAKAKRKKEGEAATAGEVDDLLTELSGGKKGVDTELTSAVNGQADAENDAPLAADNVDDLLAALGGGDADVGGGKKKPKKKKKKGGAKDEDAANAPSVSADAGAKPKKKESVAVRRMREQRERMAAEEERDRMLKEEEEARIAEEERLKEEAMKKKEEDRARKKAAEKAKRDKRRQEGTLLTKAEKEKKRKAEQFRQQILAQGLVSGATASAANDGEEEKPKRVVYDSRRKKRNNKKQTDVDSEVTSRDVELPQKASAEASTLPAEQTEPAPAPVDVPEAWDEMPEVVEDAASTTPGVSASGVNAGNADGIADDDGTRDADGSEDSNMDSDDSDYEGMSKAEIAAEKRVDAIRRARRKRKADALAARTPDHLRSPVICILGHVDTGKTKILDRIRKTNVQDGEAGGITQQIGATYFPIEAVKKEATKLAEGRELSYNVPSLLIIDTPGHESFTNLRSRGSSLCDIAILVIDIMHGLEPQTRESIDLLKLRKTPFIVALNKIDRIYDWEAQPHNCPTRDTLVKQKPHAQDEFKRRCRETQVELAEIGFNTELYWENHDVRKNLSIVPTSAISGEGIPDLLMLLLALPQKLLLERIMFNSVLEATVLEVKVIEGLGTTIDIILTGGTIREGNTIMVVGLEGPIVTTIRALLTPHPMKEMRVKGQYLHHKAIKAAQGIKISADGLEKAVAGTQLMVVEDPNDEDEMTYVREEVMKDFTTILQNVDKSGMGVYVQASTLGSLEALLEFLRTSKIAVSGINIGPVHKRDITKASAMLEKRKEYASVLAFDVKVEGEARDLADDLGVKIFTADIIYHLFDQFTAYMEDVKKIRREEVRDEVVFPVICRILPQHIYNKKDPIVVGVDVAEGILRVGTPLAIRTADAWLKIGRVVSIELNKKQVTTARKGDSVAVKIQDKHTDHIMYGRHFDFQNQLVSKMTREAIDLLKDNFREDLTTEDWRLVVKLKGMFGIL